MGQLRNPHPGEILKEEFLNEIGMSQNRLANAIGVPGNRIHAIVNGTRDITADTDLRLFGKPESFTKRRMGVIAATGKDTDEARSRAKLAASKVKPVKI